MGGIKESTDQECSEINMKQSLDGVRKKVQWRPCLALAWSRLPVARQPLTAVTEAAPLCSERLLDTDAWQRGMDANAKSTGNAQRF